MCALELSLKSCRYPVHDLGVHASGGDDVEIEAMFAVTVVREEALEAFVRDIAQLPAVRQAFWSPSATE